MGAYYARNDGVAPDVAQAIEDHYKPRFAGDQLPMSMVGLVVAMADKMETLVGMFGIGNLPTGDKDPFALRRHALGVIRMLIDKKIPISIQQLIDICASSFEKQTIAEFDKNKLEQFFLERVANLLESEDVIPSHVSAVMESVKLNTWSHVRERLEAVAQFSLLPASEALAAANKRISNILKKSSDFINAEVNQSLLIEKAEQDLYTQLINIAEKADTCFNAGDYKANLTVLAGLRDSVDAFFNEVMVNAEDQAIRQNRLSLLNKLHAQMNQVADLSRLAS
jgi:glycyl-tRNA synthetase beta chain